MKNIAIIAAMEEEMKEIKKLMKNIREEEFFDLRFYIGDVNNKDIILVQCGIGKVNAARVTQLLIDKYNVELIINVGSAGSANDNLEIGDIVVADKLVQHDFDITAFGHKKGYISNVGEYIRCDENLINKMKIAIENSKINAKIGTVASGDIFCTKPEMREKINKKFNADAIEMEGASIAQVCYLCNKPFIIIRGISDKPNGQNNVTFEKYLEKASKMCAIILENFLKQI